MLLRILLISFTAIVLIIVAAIIWPMPNIDLPNEHTSIVIRAVNVVDVHTGDVLYRRNVWIEDQHIKSIDSLNDNSKNASLEIDGTGKYLIPGLWDMHTHSTQYSEWLHHPLYIANGVTSIRDMSGQLGEPDSYWAGTTDRMGWNKRLAAHQQTTPRYILQSSYQINGSNSVPGGFPEFFKMEKEGDASKLLRYYQKEGADFIKVYAEIPAQSYRELAHECANYEIHLAGHKPLNVSLEEAITSGQRSFEHGRIFMFDCYPGADELLRAEDKGAVFRNAMRSMVNDFDSLEAVRLMDLMKMHQAYWVPTLATVKMSAFADDPQFVNSPYLDYIPTMRKSLWWNPDLNRAAESNLSEERKGINKAYYEAVKQQVAMAHRRGVPIMAGTDVTDTYTFPGFGLHTELEDLSTSGLSNLEALQSATIAPARYSRVEGKLGSVEEGKLADLVILSANPIVDIASTKQIEGVILNGTYYNNDMLEALKAGTRSLASSFHMNVKFVYSLLASPLMRKQFAD